jgi:diguanylate cyclase (GGDEF)-like protein
MKLEKLRLLRDELNEEFLSEGIESQIYYFHNNKWHHLDNIDSLTALTITRLDKCKDMISWRPRNTNTAWYGLSEIRAAISLKFKKSPRHATVNFQRQKIDKALKRATNSYKVSHNPLTELLARDSFRKHIESQLRELSSVSAHTSVEKTDETFDEVVAVLSLDIDHFKQVNDTYGHLYGDQVLKSFAIRLEKTKDEILKENSNLNIHVGHPSGEEFLVLISGLIEKNTVLSLANRFRECISKDHLPNDAEWSFLQKQDNFPLKNPPALQERMITASIGLSIISAITTDKIQDHISSILEESDSALYRAKAAGRDQVITFDSILNECGKVLEHDLSNDVIAIDIGKNVGVTLGQEFKVYPPSYTGKKQFTISDGRTVRAIGNYPRVQLTTIAVFEVQSEISFAYILDSTKNKIQIDVGSSLESIPTGSINHLLTESSKYTTVIGNLNDFESLKTLVDSHAEDDIKPFAAVFRYSTTEEFLKKYGSAAFNAALAKLYNEARSIFHDPALIRQLGLDSIVMVNLGPNYFVEDIEEFILKINNLYPELKLKCGVFNDADFTDATLVQGLEIKANDALEFARYAAADYAAQSDNIEITHFNVSSAYRILFELRRAKANIQGLTDFKKLKQLGFFNSSLLNLAGLFAAALNNHILAAEYFEEASKLSPDSRLYKSNFGTSAYELSETERGLKLLNTIPDDQIEGMATSHSHGYACYAALLAHAKIIKSEEFIPERFNLMAEKALEIEKDISWFSTRYKIIKEAMALN